MIHLHALLIGFFFIGFGFILYMVITMPKEDDGGFDVFLIGLVLIVSYVVGWVVIKSLNLVNLLGIAKFTI